MKYICQQLSGSRSYGLDIPTSDYDRKGVFVSTSIDEIIGINRFDHKVFKDEGIDYTYYELRQFLRHLKKSNTTSIEILFDDKFQFRSNEWDLILKYKYQLLDSASTFKCLMGYLKGERDLFTGRRTGDYGSKRRLSIEANGYSEKNFIHAVRLAWSGIMFFNQGVFPVYMPDFNISLCSYLLNVRQNPKNYDKAVLSNELDGWESSLKIAFENRKHNYVFDENCANNICLEIYYPILSDLRYPIK